MLKVVIRRPGGYERLQLVRGVDPRPGPGEVQVAVRAIGVNYSDCLVRMGLYGASERYVGWPVTPGFEVAGTVAAVGSGVDDLRPGQRVIAVARFGGYASQLVVPRRQVFVLPHGIDLAQAAGFAVVFLSAYYALQELAHPRPGQDLLVHSAAGGVGGALVQLGALMGCRVTGVVGGSHKVDVARGAGADAVIDKSRQDLWSAARRLAPQGYHVVFDANGAQTLGQSYRHLAVPGKLVVYGFHSLCPRRGGRVQWLKLALGYLRTPRFLPFRLVQDNRSVLAFHLSYLFGESELLAVAMGRLLGWLDAGAIKPPNIRTFALERAADAHRALESGHTTGKLILMV